MTRMTTMTPIFSRRTRRMIDRCNQTYYNLSFNGLMSVYLYQTKAGFSTNEPGHSSSRVSSSRSFQRERQESSRKAPQRKVFNMNDQQRRIRRQQASLYKQSSQQQILFDKGIKKINPVFTQTKQEPTIKRSYFNKQTYNVVNPTPNDKQAVNQGGVKRIYLYDQRKQSNPHRSASQSRKKPIKDTNKQTQNQGDSGVFLVAKLPTHKNAPSEWHNSTTCIKLRKKQNKVNKQNLNSQELRQSPKKTYKDASKNIKNQSHLTTKQNGITLSQGDALDFNQRYYQKYSRLQTGPKTDRGYLSYRRR